MGGYMPEGGGGRAARAGRYPPLASLVVSTIAAFSAVIVIAVLHSVCPAVHSCILLFDSRSVNQSLLIGSSSKVFNRLITTNNANFHIDFFCVSGRRW
jgi:hypothetical protein